MSFTYDAGTDVARIRLRICDTNEHTARFQDEEIQDIPTEAGNVAKATARLARVLLMDKARFAKSFSVSHPNETRTVDETAAVQYLQSLIAMYEADSPTLPLAVVRVLGSYPSDPFYDS